MPYYFYSACTVNDLPVGGRLRDAVEGYPVCLYNVEGTYFASTDSCPHERVSLGDGGTLDGATITCGAHRWSFDVRTGECHNNPGHKLRLFPVGRKGDEIFVGFWVNEGDGEEPRADP
ncbi:MAG TPA: non-heme iron oxygenase ferredoxin subunit [Deltaproteobacteria bacterium]|nr:non-heme iron oxygenase ferredoxin subunit [Deltaproteobacteria bacterium]